MRRIRREEGPSEDDAERRRRRARADLTRYVVHNKLTVLVTLTLDSSFPGLDDRQMCMDAVARSVIRGLQRRYGKIPYLFTAEFCPGGSVWHIHLLLDRWVPEDLLVRLWSYGIVDNVEGRFRFRGKRFTVEEVAAQRAIYDSKWRSEDIPAASKMLFRAATGFKPPTVEFFTPDLVSVDGHLDVPAGGQ